MGHDPGVMYSVHNGPTQSIRVTHISSLSLFIFANREQGNDTHQYGCAVCVVGSTDGRMYVNQSLVSTATKALTEHKPIHHHRFERERERREREERRERGEREERERRERGEREEREERERRERGEREERERREREEIERES